MEVWHRFKSRYIVNDRWLHLRADSCRTHRGAIVDPYYVVEAPNWVNVVALTKQHEILLVRQYRHAVQMVVTEDPDGHLLEVVTPGVWSID
jgi:ADP-ribose pyrophosphatase